MRVLLVDEDAQAQVVHREYLSRYGFQILEAATVEGALEHLVSFEVDVLVIDIGLAKACNWQVIEYARKELKRSTLDLPIIVLSGVEGVDIQLDYLRHDVNDWLGKPVKPLARLLARIWTLLGEKGQADAVDQH